MGINSCGTTLIDNGTFKNIGAITWDTTAKTAGFTAVAGNGYFCNTTSAAFTVTLPSSPTAGDTVGISDYANTADTNNITIGRNGSNIQGVANDFIINIEGASVLLTYVDATKGWLLIDAARASDIEEGPTYIVATGGSITTSGDYKIHTFTGPGTFTVCSVGNPVGGGSNVDYLVVAGGGGGGNNRASGGGAGGYRESHSTPVSGCYTASPLATPTGITVSATPYPITVGGGGGATGAGSNSIFSTVTSAGGGGGVASSNGAVGGSGSGASCRDGNSSFTGGAGNTPPVSPPQGNSGGNASGSPSGGYRGAGAGGGGAGAAGSPSPNSNTGGNGGNGSTSSINASSITRAGGGGGGAPSCAAPFGGPPPGTAGTGGSGGGGAGNTGCGNATSGTANTGGGGGGSGQKMGSPNVCGGAGGSGIVIIRYKYQ